MIQLTIPATASITVMILSLLLGLSSLYVFRVTHRQREFIQFLLAMGAAAYAVAEIPLTIETSDAVLLWGMRAQLTGAALHAIGWMHLSILVGNPDPNPRVPTFQRGFDLFSGTLALLCLIPAISYSGSINPRPVQWLHVVYRDPTPTPLNELMFATLIFGLAIAMVRFSKQAMAGNTEARYHAGALFLLTVAGITDSLAVLGHLDTPYILTLGLFVSVVISWFLATREFAKNARTADEASRALAETVERRTEALSRTRLKLQRAEELAGIGRLAAGVAHEINNPAAVVISNVQYVLDELAETGGALTDPRDIEDALRRSLAQMERVDRIVKDLLIAGRVAGRQEHYTESIAIEHSVNEALELCDLRGVEVEKEIHHAEVLGHAAVLVPVIRNLVSNSIDAMQGSIRPRNLTIRSWNDGEWTAIEIRDNGHGMDEETLDGIFEPFFTTKPPGQGTGLGIPVSLGLVRSLGGTLSFTSEVDHGTTALLRLQRSS